MSPPRAIPPRSAPRCPREPAAATNFFAAKAARGGNQPRRTGSAAAAHSDWSVRSAPPRIGPRPPSSPAPRGSARQSSCRRLARALRPLPAKRSLARNLGGRGRGEVKWRCAGETIAGTGRGGSALVALRWRKERALQAGAEAETLITGSRINYCWKGLGSSWGLLCLGLVGWQGPSGVNLWAGGVWTGCAAASQPWRAEQRETHWVRWG